MARRAGKPADVLLRAAILRHIVQDVKGQVCIPHRVIAENLILEGDVAVGVLRVDAIAARRGAELLRHQAAVLIRRTQQRIVRQINGYTGGRLAVSVLHTDRPAAAHDDGLSRKRIIGRHRQSGFLRREGAPAQIGQLIGAGLYGIAEHIALPQLYRHVKLHSGDEVAALRAFPALCVNGQRAGKALIGIAALIAVGKLHCVVREQLAQLQLRGNALHVVAPDLQAKLLPQHRRCAVRLHRDGRRRIVRSLHREVCSLGGLVTGLVAHRDGERVRAVGQSDVAQVRLLTGGDGLEVVVRIVVGVDAVDVDTHRVEPAGVAVVHVVLLRGEVEHTVGEHRTVGQGLLVHGDAADDRVVHVVHIGAVHKLHVVKVEAARRLRTQHLGAVDVHQAEGHTGLDGKGTVKSPQVRLQIAPAFPPHTGILVGPGALVRAERLGLKGEVVWLVAAVAVGHIASEPQSGGCAVAFPLDAHALGHIHPHADRRGHTGDRDLVAGAHARAFRHVGAGTEVEVELEGVAAKAHRLIIVDTDDLRRLHAALAIVAGKEIAAIALAANGVILLGGRDCAGLRIGVVLKVKHQRGQLAHDQVDAGGDAAVKCGGHRHCAVKALPLGGGKEVAVKGSQLLVGQRPQQVARLIVHVAAPALHFHAEVRAVVEAQADLLGVEVNAVGLGKLNDGAAHHDAAAHRLHGHVTLGLRTGLEQARGRIDLAERRAVLAERKGDILRQRHVIAAAVNAGSRELDLGAGRVDLAAGQQSRMVKLSAGLGRGDQQKTRQRGTLGAIGRGIFDGSLVAALTLCDKGGGAAAVAVEHVRAAEADHHGGKLVHAHTGRHRLLTTVVDHHHQRAVGLETHHRARRTAGRGMILSGIQAHTVLDNVAPRRNGLHLRAVERLAARPDRCLAILVDHQIVVSIAGVIMVHRTVDDQHARRIVGSPGEVDVGSAHHIIAQRLRCRDLLCHHLVAVVGFRNGSAPAVELHVLIAGHNGYIGIAQICLQHMAHVLICTRAVVENDLFFRNAGRDLIGLLRDHGIVCIALRCGLCPGCASA